MIKSLLAFLILITPLLCRADYLTVNVIGLTLHGPGMEINTADKMPRKIDSGGRLIRHPELNMTYKTEENFIYNATWLRDCFDNSAWFAGAGKSYHVTENGSFQLTFGIYARPKVANIDVSIAVQKDGMDYIPTPWAGYSYDIPLTEYFSLNAQVNSNVLLTHSSFGLTYKLK